MRKVLENSNTNNPPLSVYLKRGSTIESRHNVHAVVCDSKGRVLMQAGNPYYETFIRSALKPFQILPFISSGAAERIKTRDKSIAIGCASHAGSTKHARESYKILWSYDIDVNSLQCPIPKSKKSQLQHNCSGKHSAFLATCKKMGWPIENYLESKHPLQQEIFRRVAELLMLPQQELIAERDDCGAPTLALQLKQISLLYAHLSGSENAEFEQIIRSILANPDLIAGEGIFDTELIQLTHGQIISKSGAEGVQCLSRVGDGIGVAIKVEDGSKRAKQAVALHILDQLEWITQTSLVELQEQVLLVAPGVQLEVNGQLKIPKTF